MTHGHASDDPTEALTAVLLQALRALGKGGAPERANRLAGRAWSAVRHSHPQQARRINALMHGLARMPSDPEHDEGAPTCQTQSSTSAQSPQSAVTA